jgi:hypothetical protein
MHTGPYELLAYIGPGGGMEFFGYAAALVAMVVTAFLSVLLWPVYKLRSWWRGNKTPPSEPPPAPPPETPSE